MQKYILAISACFKIWSQMRAGILSIVLSLMITAGNEVNAQDSLEMVSSPNLNSEITHGDWMFFVFLFVFFLLAIARVFYAKSFIEGFNSFKSFNVAHQNFKTQNLKLYFVDVALFIVFILMFSLFAFLALNKQFNWPDNIHVNWYFAICLLTVIAFGLKLFANKILTEILPIKESLHFANFLFWSGIKMLGLILIPVALFAVYNPFITIQLYLMNVLVVLSIALFIMYVLRLLKLGKDYIYKSKFHFFLYICAFEIAPIFMILKFNFLIINKLQQVFI